MFYLKENKELLGNLILLLLSILGGAILVKYCDEYEKWDKNEEKIVIIQKDTVYINSPLQKIITLTTYNPIESQCDDSPLITANGTKIDLDKLKKGELKYCAVSPNLLNEIPYGSIIYIEGYGEYLVCDIMNSRLKNYVDILQDESKRGFKKENVRILKVK